MFEKKISFYFEYILINISIKNIFVYLILINCVINLLN